jgi:pantetheine-phosphate adenylyltransferase
MSKQVVAIYPGTFDPISLGHEDIVLRAAAMFDKVILAVATAHHKKTLFDLDERMDMAREAMVAHPEVEVVPFNGLARDFVRSHNATVMVRGVRTVTDFDYEFQLAGMNRELMPEVETVFLTPSAKYQFISSTFVREISLLGEGNDGQNLVSAGVYKRLLAKRTAVK